MRAPRRQGKEARAEKSFGTEVMSLDRQRENEEREAAAGPAEMEEVPRRTPRPPDTRVEKARRKVSLVAAIVVNVVTLITLAIILLAVLLPGYRRSFTVARAVEGAEEVFIMVRTTEAMMREKNTDFLRAQDGLRNVLQEEVGKGDTVWAYVRDAYPDRKWIEDNLPEGMVSWLRELYPKPEVVENAGKAAENGASQDVEKQGTEVNKP